MSAARKPMMMGNWKMNGGLQANQDLLRALRAVDCSAQVRAGACVPFPYLSQAQAEWQGSGWAWGAQDLSVHDKGAYTGEVSAAMLREFAVRYVLVGNSERRQYHGESDDLVANKAKQALAHGITPTTVKKNVEDVLSGLWQGDTDQSRITAKVDKPMVGQNLAAHLDALRLQMRKAAENLEFEEAARLRDEVKRLEAVELAVADDPLARQSAVEEAADAAVRSSGRSTAGRAGQRGGNKRRR